MGLPGMFLAIVALLSALIIVVTPFGMAHDDGVYLVTAKSLAEGTGYRIISLPNTPIQTKYPILFPFLLSFAWRINPKFPANAGILKAVPVASMLIWLSTSYWFARRFGGLPGSAAMWLVFFVAVNQWSLFTIGILMSDSLFSLLLLFTLALLVRTDERHSLWTAAAAAMCAAATIHTRTAGLPLVLAGTIALAGRKRFREAVVFSGVVAPFIVVWALWQQSTPTFGTWIENYYAARSYIVDSLFDPRYSIVTVTRLFLKNVYFLCSYPAAQMFGLKLLHPFRYVLPIGGLALWLVIFQGWKRSKLFAVKVFVPLYVCMLLVYVWSPDRYLLPLLPILCAFAFRALPRKTPRWIVPAIAAMPLVLAFYSTRSTLTHHVAAFAQPPWSTPAPVVDWSQMSRVQAWVGRNVPADAVVLSNFDSAMYLYSGRQAIRPFGVLGAELFYGIHRDLAVKVQECLGVIAKYHIRYLIESGHDGEEEPAYPEMLQALVSAGRLRLRWELAPHYRVFEIVP